MGAIEQQVQIVLYERPESSSALEELIAGMQTDGIKAICNALNKGLSYRHEQHVGIAVY
jgi:hypothetical protein